MGVCQSTTEVRLRSMRSVLVREMRVMYMYSDWDGTGVACYLYHVHLMEERRL